MHDFRITLRVDSPLLLGGAGPWGSEPTCALRGPSVRGLLHTFARAMMGPHFIDDEGQLDFERLRTAERRLLGSSADDRTGQATFRVQDRTSVDELVSCARNPIKYAVLPHDMRIGNGLTKGGGKKQGIPPDQRYILELQPRASALKGSAKGQGPILHFEAMLWSVAWTAFTIGALGQRSRRGYGSLSIVAADSPPRLDGISHDSGTLPLFEHPATDLASFARPLKRGLDVVRHVTEQWLLANGFSHRPRYPDVYPIFCLPADASIYIGQPSQSSVSEDWGPGEKALRALMNKCSDEKDNHNDYPKIMGGIGSKFSDRLASPFWYRVHRSNSGGYFPVVTYSPRVDAGPNGPAEAVLRTLGAKSLPELLRPGNGRP